MIIDDVMKGNWISYKKIPHMINKIMGDDVVLSNHYSSDGGEYITGISECEPIKLTKDVLIECGFYEIKEKFVLDSGNNMIFLTCNGDGDFMLSVALCDMHMKVEYIHQLQQ